MGAHPGDPDPTGTGSVFDFLESGARIRRRILVAGSDFVVRWHSISVGNRIPVWIRAWLALAIWRRSLLAAYAYMVWPVVAIGGVAALVYAIFGRVPRELCQINCAYLAWGARTPAVGLWLALSGLALLWIGGGARLASLRRAGSQARRIAVMPALRSLLSPARIGALIVTVGIAVWLFGYIFTPWATQGCTGFPVNWSHFVSGSCAGLDSDEVLVYATASGFGSGSLLGAGVLYVLLGMLVALIAIWQRGWIPPVISLIWIVSATWLTALAISGIPGMLRSPQHFNFSTAPWVVGYGPAVAVTGAVIVWVGVVALWWAQVAGWRNSPRRLALAEPPRAG